MNLTELQQVDAGAWIAIIALSLSLAFIIARSRSWTRVQVRRATSDLEGLNAFHKALLSDLSLEKVLALLTQAIAPGMGFQAASVCLRQPIAQPRTDHKTADSIRLETSEAVHLQAAHPVYLEALFSSDTVQHDGLMLLPLADSKKVGGAAQCWMQPDARCNVLPRATMATRQTLCPTCEHFAVLGLLVVSHFGRVPSGAIHLREYADAAALAIKNARLYESEALERGLAQRKAAELQLIYSVGKQVMGASDQRVILERLLDNLGQFLAPRAGNALKMRVALRVGDDVRVLMTANGTQQTWLGDGVITKDHLAMVTSGATPIAGEGMVTIPLLIVTGDGDVARAIGALEVICEAALDVSLLTTLGAQAAIALGHINELRALQQREVEVTNLAALGRAFAAPFSRDPQGALRQLCEAVRGYVGANCIITGLELRQSLETRVISSCSALELHYPAGEDNLTIALSQTRQTRSIPDIASHSQTRVEAATFGAVAMLSVPLLSGERFIGALHALQPVAFSDAQIAKLEGVAGQVALVLDNLDLLNGLRSESERLEDVLEHLAEGVLVLENSTSDSLIPELIGNRRAGSGRANAAARKLLGVAPRFSLTQLPAQVRASLEYDSSSLNIGEQRFEVLTKRSAARTVVVLQDVSAFDAAQRSKAEFLSVVSHELRTPLTSIIGFVDLMLSGAVGLLSTEQEDFLQTTQIASQTLFQTVQNLLIASNLEAGLFELRPHDTRLNLAKRLDRFAVLATQKQLSFHLELPAPQRVHMDVERIGLVLDNLVSNAVRYTPSGGEVRVHVHVRGHTLEASVSDSGGGLRPDQEARLYQKFSRNARNASEGEGAGIALYVAKAIVQASGGRLWSENRLGRGLTMHFAVPLETPAVQEDSSDWVAPKLN